MPSLVVDGNAIGQRGHVHMVQQLRHEGGAVMQIRLQDRQCSVSFLPLLALW